LLERENLRGLDTFLTSVMNAKGLMYLSLQSNLINDGDAKYIGEALANNTTLLEINLCNIIKKFIN
jgi:hypothetical protein